jgi:hypothetical protein
MEKSVLVKRKRKSKRRRQSVVPLTVPGKAWTIQSDDTAWAPVGWDLNGSLSRILVSDPKWEEKVAKNQDATNDYSVSRFPCKSPYINGAFSGNWTNRTTRSPVKVQTASLQGYLGASQARPDNAVFVPVDIVRLDTLAKLGMLAKIRELEHSWSAPTFLGELKETIHMVRNPLGGLFREARSYRRRARRIILSYRRRPGKMMDLLNNQYLQWTYGVSPLINDVKGAMSAIKEFLTPKIESITRLQTTLKETVSPTWWVGSRSGFYELESGRIRLMYARDAELTSSVRYICGVLEETQGPSTARAVKLSEMNLAESFVPTVYELLPYSFLLDYVSTVGSVVNGAFTHTGNVVWKCKNQKDKTVAGVILIPMAGTTGVPLTYPFKPHVRVLAKELFKREGATLDVGFKDVRLKMPNTGQLINTLSLGFARFRSDDLDFGRNAWTGRRF